MPLIFIFGGAPLPRISAPEAEPTQLSAANLAGSLTPPTVTELARSDRRRQQASIIHRRRAPSRDALRVASVSNCCAGTVFQSMK